MKALEALHGAYVAGRRARVLALHVAQLLPPDARVLDVGCGSGEIAALILTSRPDVEVTGTDVHVRPETAIRVEEYDGRHVPFPADSFDTALLVDVLHHADDPVATLRDAARVARSVIVKDVVPESRLDYATLAFMDRVGNARFGVALPYAFLSAEEWQQAFASVGLRVAEQRSRLGLYPPPANLVFERSLHFIAVLHRDGAES